jgi:AcrR family transcriptional regulator
VDSQEVDSTASSRRRSYHHGNLRDALIDLAIELITRDGVASFSIAEACRRLNVSPGAPYRHFADREDLLTEIAIRGCEIMTGHISQVVGDASDPVERLVRASRAYVEFAAQHPALFEVLYTKEVFMGGNAKLIEAVRPIVEAFLVPASAIPGITAAQASSLTVGAAAVAHGYASFLPAGTFSAAPDSLAIAADNAACATRALIIGRAALASSPGEHGVALAGMAVQNWIDLIGTEEGKVSDE